MYKRKSNFNKSRGIRKSRGFKRPSFTKKVKQIIQNVAEVKYTSAVSAVHTLWMDNSTSTTLQAQHQYNLIAWPVKGINMNERIGDAITPVKLWIRVHINNVQENIPIHYRIIILGFEAYYASAISVPNFWKYNGALADLLCNDVDRAGGQIVVFDKTYVMKPSVSWVSGQLATGSRIHNINLKKFWKGKKVLLNSANSPKDPEMDLRICVIGMNVPNGSEGTTIGGWTHVAKLYYTDT